jgi:hypothetical protein
LLRIDDSAICSVPPQWTDVVSPDPEVVTGQGRSPFRVADLIELARLVAHLSSEKLPEEPSLCKDNFAANVKQMTPQRR